MPQSRWGDCSRAAFESVDWKEDPRGIAGYYKPQDHTMVLMLLAPVSSGESYDYRDRVQKAVGLKTVLVVEDKPPSRICIDLSERPEDRGRDTRRAQAQPWEPC